MGRIPDQFIDDLLARTDIVEVVQARVPLKKKGNEYTACCPFHNERSPSFFVSPNKQFYHCFGCGAHGTAISFLMNFDRLEFLDAIDELAKQAGVEVPKDTRQQNRNAEAEPLFGGLDAASRFYQAQLSSSDVARKYLAARGLSASTIERFNIGYAPDSFDGLMSRLGTDARRMEVLEKAGMFSRNDNGRVYDKFRHRVMFPIHDRRGRVIGFGGRVLSDDQSPKYLNSPETPLFHKGRELYGLWQAKQANNKLDRLLVVEGYMDVVSLAQHGIDFAVATLGTATTPEHAELLFRSAPIAVFSFDGDSAGRRAAWKAVESVLPAMRDGRRAQFLFLPDGEDPDTIVRSEGAAAFNARLDAATDLSEFYFAQRAHGLSMTTTSGKATLLDRCRDDIAKIPDGGFRDALVARIHELTGVDLGKSPQGQVARQNASMHVKRSLVRHAISLLLQDPSLALDIPDPRAIEGLDEPGVPLLISLIETMHARPQLTTGGLLEAFDAHGAHGSLTTLAGISLPGDHDSWLEEMAGVFAQLEGRMRNQRIDALRDRLSELTQEEKMELRDLLATRVANHAG